jgi:hypothetical protein
VFQGFGDTTQKGPQLIKKSKPPKDSWDTCLNALRVPKSLGWVKLFLKSSRVGLFADEDCLTLPQKGRVRFYFFYNISKLLSK